MRHEFRSSVDEFAINGMLHLPFFSYHDGFVHLVAYYDPDPFFS
jgi:hypothetical protein